jgi:hypothetical protein
MRSCILKSTATLLLVLGLLASNSHVAAKTGKSGDPNLLKGYHKRIVEVAKDKDGNITSVTLTKVDKKPIHITLDEKGKELGTKLAGKTIIVIGTVETKNKEKWLTISQYCQTKAKTKKASTKETPKTSTETIKK